MLRDLQLRPLLRLMLTVYLYRAPRPAQALDLSLTPLEEIADTALSFHAHQSSGSIWFGYLEGWMLTPQQEALLRQLAQISGEEVANADKGIFSRIKSAFS